MKLIGKRVTCIVSRPLHFDPVEEEDGHPDHYNTGEDGAMETDR